MGVTAAAMGLSRLFQGANTDFTTEPRPRLLSFSTAAAYLPIHPHPPYSAHAPHTYRTRGIDRPRGSEMSITRSVGGRRAERVEVLFDDLLALVHELPVLDFRPCTTNPTAPHAPHTTCTRPCAGIAARSASNTRAALPTPGRASRAVPRKDRKWRIHAPTRQGSPARTPDLTSATCLCLRLGP